MTHNAENGLLAEPCSLGRREYDQARYCHTHGGFLHGGDPGHRCDRARPIPPAKGGAA